MDVHIPGGVQWVGIVRAVQSAADLHGSLAASCSLLQKVQNVQATPFCPPHSSPRDADGQGQEALSHVQESLAKLLLLLAALKVWASKD